MLKPALVLSLLLLAGPGCAYLMPPQKIPMDRRNYIEAVSTSWKEQLLTNLVKLRYGDTLTFLEMTSINTSYSLDANLTAAPLPAQPQLPTRPISAISSRAKVGYLLGQADDLLCSYQGGTII